MSDPILSALGQPSTQPTPPSAPAVEVTPPVVELPGSVAPAPVAIPVPAPAPVPTATPLVVETTGIQPQTDQGEHVKVFFDEYLKVMSPMKPFNEKVAGTQQSRLRSQLLAALRSNDFQDAWSTVLWYFHTGRAGSALAEHYPMRGIHTPYYTGSHETHAALVRLAQSTADASKRRGTWKLFDAGKLANIIKDERAMSNLLSFYS